MPTPCTRTSRRSQTAACIAVMMLMAWVALPAWAAPQDLFGQLAKRAPEIDRGVLKLALRARDCADRGQLQPTTRMAVIDYSLPSTRRRLWVLDLVRGQVLFSEHVAHGRGSGDNLARQFSNREGSYQTSLGLFRTSETYLGANGYSLRMDGLERGINDAARERLLVMHGADYVDAAQALRQGRLGRSWGCPAVRRAVARPLLDSLKGGQLLFAYYPDRQWLNGSRFLGCPAVRKPSARPRLHASSR